MRARGRSGRVGGKAFGGLQRRGAGGRQRTAAAAASSVAVEWIDRWGREGRACSLLLPLLVGVGVSLHPRAPHLPTPTIFLSDARVNPSPLSLSRCVRGGIIG